jgi:arsenite methyltransferase
MKSENQTLSEVENYYGEVLSRTEDLQTNACCSLETIPTEHKQILKLIEPEILERSYGCGSPIPPLLKGISVLDLGCGVGRDSFLISHLVGPEGRVIGLDMTAKQLEIPRRLRDTQMQKFGFEQPNIEFLDGKIEDLEAAQIQSESLDLVISNCVINLSVDKQQVFSEIFRVLSQGGELYFSDVFANRRIPENLKSDPVLYGECLSGALYFEDFRRIMQSVGFLDFRVVSQAPVTVENPKLQSRIGNIKFSSLTIRAFKLDELEDRCEDFGQVAIYKGTIPNQADSFILDDHHEFETGRPMLVCGNTAAMLSGTRFKDHFEVQGDHSRHFGLFDCGPEPLPSSSAESETGSCC